VVAAPQRYHVLAKFAQELQVRFTHGALFHQFPDGHHLHVCVCGFCFGRII
jgi:hypothetical protein